MKLNKTIIEDCFKIVNKENDRSTWDKLAEKYGYKTGEHLRQSFKSYRKRNGNLPSIEDKVLEKYGLNESKAYKESVSLNENGIQESDKKLEVKSNDKSCLKDNEYVLKMHGYDPSKWDIINARNSFWDTQVKGGEVVELYSSKIKVQPKKNPEVDKDIVKKVFESLYDIPKRKLELPDFEGSGDRLLFIRLSDFHYNLKSSLLTTGNEYNVEIAERYFNYVIDNVVNMYELVDLDKILFIIGDDFLNADNIQGTTTKGTPQDTDISWEEALIGASKLITSAIERLRELAPVDVINIQSNHDQHTMFAIAEILKARYEGYKGISIINEPVPNQYYVYGDNLICLAHDIKVSSILKILTKEARQYLSLCKNIYYILAHLHQGMEYEEQGDVKVFRMPTISGWSRWGKGKGFIHSDKRADIYLFDKEDGIVEKRTIKIK